MDECEPLMTGPAAKLANGEHDHHTTKTAPRFIMMDDLENTHGAGSRV